MILQEIPRYKNYYASDDGEIYSRKSGDFKVLSKTIHNGYYRVHIFDGKTSKKNMRVPVHQLVLEAYEGERKDKQVCRHLNGNPLDNRISNLCWETTSENVRDSMRHGTAACLRRGENSVAAKLTEQDIYDIKMLYKLGWKQREIAERYSITSHHVSDIVNNKTWTHLSNPFVKYKTINEGFANGDEKIMSAFTSCYK